MNRKIGLRFQCLALLLATALLAPLPGQAKEEGKTTAPKMQRQKLVQELNLTPSQTKEFLAVAEKYEQTRQEIIEGIRNKEGELEKALAAPKPDEGQIKGLVAAITAGHDQLFESFKAQRQEERALLTPVQQGKFVLALKRWHKEMREKYEKKEKKD